jgi:hypothetical protein
MGQAKVVIHLIHSQLLPYARLAFAEGHHPTSDSRHMLTDRE